MILLSLRGALGTASSKQKLAKSVSLKSEHCWLATFLVRPNYGGLFIILELTVDLSQERLSRWRTCCSGRFPLFWGLDYDWSSWGRKLRENS